MYDAFNAYEYANEYIIPHIPYANHPAMETIFHVLASTCAFSLLDIYLFKRCAGSYYAIHSLCNAAIVCITFPDVYKIYTSTIETSLAQSDAIYASSITYGLHFYHILLYHSKLRFDDYLHHGLMIFVALPLANYFGSVHLLGHSLFYTTGLPGMIDYACLYAVRSKYMDRIREKQINRFLNTYIRNPGCTIHAFITMMALQQTSALHYIDLSVTNIIIAVVTALLVFWNGVYFMDQVVGNYYVVRESQKELLPRNYKD